MTLPPGTYRCLSLWQPWAWALFHGKTIENRGWSSRYRGPLLIQAAKRTIGVEETVEEIDELFHIRPVAGALEFGKIIGMVELYDCRWSQHPSPCGWGFAGSWHWHVRNPRLLDAPLPWRGLQQIFPVAIGTPSVPQPLTPL